MATSQYYIELNEIIGILKDKIDIVLTYDYSELIKNLDEPHIKMLLDQLLLHFQNDNSYKYETNTNLFTFLTNLIIKATENKINCINFLTIHFLDKVSLLNKGQYLLEKLKKIISENISKDYIINNIFIQVCSKGTLPIYFFWRKYINNEDFVKIFDKALSYSCINNDLRIFKYIILKEKVNNKNQLIDIETVIINIFSNIFDHRNSKKKSYKLLKILDEVIPLNKYFHLLLDYGYTHYLKLNKYYHKYDLSFDVLNNLIRHQIILIDAFDSINFNINDINSNVENKMLLFNQFKETLISPYEKTCFLIIKNLYVNSLDGDEICLINTDLFKDIINKNNNKIIDNINYIDMVSHSTPILSKIIKYYYNKSLFSQYIKESIFINNNLYLYTRFFHYSNKKVLQSIELKYNKILHKLRCYAKKYKSIKFKESKFKLAPVINEIKNYVPNKKVSILKRGSIGYQNTKQKFTYLPPRHILPNEINYLSNCLIKEKSDGINVTKLPNIIYPLTSIINNNIKAEYIEDLDLYLVYDIDINNMNIIERQEYLRQIHPFTKNLINFQQINNINELIKVIEYERNNIINFINSTTEEIKWYPKASFKIDIFNEKFINEINSYVEEIDNSINSFINDEYIIKNDGLILTPLDGSQEIKIKPKKLQTIDLLYTNNNWVDSNNIIHTNIITKNKCKDNKIYRCYPIINENEINFVPKEIRYDKKRPNSNKICILINCILKMNWLINYNNINTYYQKNNKVYILNIINILEYNKKFMLTYIKNINPTNNKYWLDLGCGNCKFYTDIKNYNPKKYVGIDNDIKLIIKSYVKFNEDQQIQLHCSNLGECWLHSSNYKIYNFNFEIKYDYIICNFSLMHFCTDLFWEQLNNVSKSGTIFMFNLTLPNILWSLNNSYLKSNDTDCEIYLEWIHDKPIKEKIILKETINNYINKYQWEIINTTKSTNNYLISCYIWYTIVKK